jgi:RNA polymerase sigma-70 factor (ECF subfamily)
MVTTESKLEHIIHGCVTAKRESQKEFYHLFYGFAMAICLRYCTTNDEAMEVVNDSFLKIFKQLPLFKPAYSNYDASLKGWMKSIVINTSIDHFRKNNKHHFFTDIQDSHIEMPGMVESTIEKMSYKEIMQIVQQLSPVYKAVFNLFVIDGFTHEEIAAQLNITIGTSKSNLSKARVNIQKMLKEATIYYEPKIV